MNQSKPRSKDSPLSELMAFALDVDIQSTTKTLLMADITEPSTLSLQLIVSITV
jgi:hypothetical protein